MKENRVLTLILMICVITSIFFLSKVLPQEEKGATMALPVEEALALELEGIVVRKEYVYYAPASGQFVMEEEEGQKVRRGAAMGVFTWDGRGSMKEIQALYEQEIAFLSTYDNIRVDLEKIRNQLDEVNDNFVKDYRASMQAGNILATYDHVDAYQASYDQLFSQQNTSAIQLEKIQRTQRELKKMEADRIEYRAPIAGIVSYVFDDYEEEFLYENVRNDLEGAYRYIHDPFVAATVDTDRDWLQPIYRLSDNSAWYVLIRLPEEASEFFKANDQFTLTCDECLVPVRARKSLTSKTDDGQYWLLEVEERFYEINDTRHLNMVLRPAKVPDGVLVSKDALTMLEGQWGVNRLRLNREMAWTPIEIIDENRDQAIVKSLEENRLRAYDEVEIQEGSSGQND